MKIYTVHWKTYTDDYYAPHTRRMFLDRDDASRFLDDLLDYEQVERYFILEEEVFEEYTKTEYNEDCHDDDYPCDIYNDF